MRATWVIGAAILSTVPACAKRSDAKVELVVQTAASLKDAFALIETGFEKAHPEVDVKLNLAGSQELRAQIENGAAADVFASADSKNMQPLLAAKLVGEPVLFTCNELVVAVPISDATVATIEDLPKVARIVVGAPEVPIGAYGRKVLERIDRERPGFLAAVEAKVVSRDLNVKQAVGKVIFGEADAAFAYRTDVLVAKDKLRAVTIPKEWNVSAEYPIAAITTSKHPDEARAFIDWVLAAQGQDALAAHGFAECETATAPAK